MDRYYTDEDVRKELAYRTAGRIQADIARTIGVKPQNLSLMLRGAPIGGKVLAWLGFERAAGLYTKSIQRRTK